MGLLNHSDEDAPSNSRELDNVNCFTHWLEDEDHKFMVSDDGRTYLVDRSSDRGGPRHFSD